MHAPLITARTRAILVLHKEGDPARLDEIVALAHGHGIKVIEDAAHAFGAKYRGVRIGNHGDFVCFSAAGSENDSATSGAAGQTVRVTILYNFTPLTPMAENIGGGSIHVQATTTMVIQGQP